MSDMSGSRMGGIWAEDGKHQAPSTKHQRSTKFQAPNARRRTEAFLEFGAWNFSGAWSLELRAFFPPVVIQIKELSAAHQSGRVRSLGCASGPWPMGKRRSESSLKPSSNQPACSGLSVICSPSLEGPSFCPG